MWFFWCLRREELWMKAFSHILHLYRFSAVLIFGWLSKFEFCLKLFLCISYFEGVLSLATLCCLTKTDFRLKFWPKLLFLWLLPTGRIFVWVIEIICKLSFLSFCFFNLSSYIQGFSDRKLQGSSLLSLFLLNPWNDESWVWVDFVVLGLLLHPEKKKSLMIHTIGWDLMCRKNKY